MFYDNVIIADDVFLPDLISTHSLRRYCDTVDLPVKYMPSANFLLEPSNYTILLLTARYFLSEQHRKARCNKSMFLSNVRLNLTWNSLPHRNLGINLASNSISSTDMFTGTVTATLPIFCSYIKTIRAATNRNKRRRASVKREIEAPADRWAKSFSLRDPSRPGKKRFRESTGAADSGKCP